MHTIAHIKPKFKRQRLLGGGELQTSLEATRRILRLEQPVGGPDKNEMCPSLEVSHATKNQGEEQSGPHVWQPYGFLQEPEGSRDETRRRKTNGFTANEERTGSIENAVQIENLSNDQYVTFVDDLFDMFMKMCLDIAMGYLRGKGNRPP